MDCLLSNKVNDCMELTCFLMKNIFNDAYYWKKINTIASQ